ncbi:MAG: hypothetical protein D6761_06330 [Candidatus Dadabacteria bacterium]|nr:MAG: hypothetical protein D6761_06330 [Candidatus Dadabacteria bacterium]
MHETTATLYADNLPRSEPNTGQQGSLSAMSSTSRFDHIIVVSHTNDGDGDPIAEQMLTLAREAVEACGKCVILHDARAMTVASESYARAFARAFSHLKAMPDVTMMACVPRAVPRMFARVATRLGGVAMPVFPDADQLCAALRQSDPDTLGRLQQAGLCPAVQAA